VTPFPRRPRGLLAAALALFLGWVALAEAGMGFAISPSNFRLQKPAGESTLGKVNVYNRGTYPMSISTEVTDMFTSTGEDGLSVRDEAPIGTTPHSCAKWIQIIQPGETLLPPGKSATVEFLVSPPPEIQAGGYGAYLFFIAKPVYGDLPGKSDKPEVRLITVPRLGVSVIYEVAGTVRREGNLLDLKLTPPTATEPMRIRHAFKNTGNAEVVLTGSFHIMDSQGLLVGKSMLKLLKTFPGETGVMESAWNSSLPEGRYTALITFELGPDAETAVVKELEFDVR
jgi:hypothetical protein